MNLKKTTVPQFAQTYDIKNNILEWMSALTFPWTRNPTSAMDEIITATKLAAQQIYFHDNLLMMTV